MRDRLQKTDEESKYVYDNSTSEVELKGRSLVKICALQIKIEKITYHL